MKIHSIRITIQDVQTTENVPVVAGFTDIFLDHGETMVDDEGQVKLDEDGLPQKKFEKISATWLLSHNVLLKREIQKMVIETITQHDIEQRKTTGEDLNIGDDYGLGIVKPKKKGLPKPKKKK